MNYLNLFQLVLKSEAEALLVAAKKIQEEDLQKILKIFELLHSTGGNLIFCGVGKSGIIGQKMSSTFVSLGMPSFFLHPTEALHGDLGRVTKSDAMVIISKSGTTEELLKLIPYLPMGPSMTIGLLGQGPSPLSEKCSVVLDCSVEKEACLNNLAPTTSTTLTMAMGDGLAVIYESLVGLSKEKFAMGHPGGILGKSLRLKVKDLMIEAAQCPIIGMKTSLRDVILKMTEMPLGICVILSENKKFLGIIVEGDIRRTFSSKEILNFELLAEEIMNKSPVTISGDKLAYEALNLMERRTHQISVLPVVEEGKFLGIIRLHDLLKEGFFLKK